MSQPRRVVITGMGIVSPVGNDLPTFWENITNGVSGIGKVTLFDVSDYDCQIAGEVKDFEPVKWFKNPKDWRRADRYSQLAMAASRMAINDAGLTEITEEQSERFGVMIGSGIGGLKSLEDQHTVLMTKGPGRISPFMIPMMISNMASGLVSMEFGWCGPNFAPVWHRGRLRAIEAIEEAALRIPGVTLCVHRFGGIGFMIDGREFAHLHGNGLLDVAIGKARARELVAEERAEPHHVLGESVWVSYRVHSTTDLPGAIALLQEAAGLTRSREAAKVGGITEASAGCTSSRVHARTENHAWVLSASE